MTAESTGPITVVTKSSFRETVLSRQTPVVVDFWAPWCVWCRKLAPIFAEVAAALKDEIVFASVNVDEERELAEEYGISSLPTLKFFCDGREIGETVGAPPRDQLQAKIREVIGMHQACLTTSSPFLQSERAAASV
jgi:thioredoxin